MIEVGDTSLVSAMPLTKQLTMLAAERQRQDLRLFIRRAWSQIIPQKPMWNWHIDAIADHLAYVTQGEIRFLMIPMPPRHLKSMSVSVMWQPWHWLHKPGTQFLFASVDDKLARRDSVLARRLIESPWYQERYGEEFYLLPEENRAQMYRNSAGGYRMFTSVQGRATGDGGDVQVLDDPHSAKKIESDATRIASIAWHDGEWRSRVNSPNRSQKVYVGQRTHDGDIFGHVLSQERHRWVVLKMPLEFDPKKRCITYLNDGRGVKEGAKPIFKDPRQEEGELLHPDHFNAETATIEREAMAERAWLAQYQQEPVGEGGLILKRAWWRRWEWPEWHPQHGSERPMPEFFRIIQVYDTAFEEDEEADFTARTTWGLFEHEETSYDSKSGRSITGNTRTCAMLLDMFCERVEWPELRQEMIDSNRDFGPDDILIEKKASGHSLIQEGKRLKLPIKAIKVDKVGDLMARVKMASLMLEKGCIFYCASSRGKPLTWPLRVIDSAAKYPNGEHDDIESTLAMAWQFMRQYHDLQLPDDERPDETNPYKWKQRRRYA